MILMFSHIDPSTNVTFDSDNHRVTNLDWSNIVDRAPFTIHTKTSVEVVTEMFKKMGLRQVLVIEYGRLIEIITKKDLLRYINLQHGSH